MKEIWKNIKGFENYYQVSNFGRVKRLQYTIYKKDNTTQTFKEKICNQYKNNMGYSIVHLRIDSNKKKSFLVHRLVATSFIPNKMKKPEINHIDGNKNNNDVRNLEWVTSSENQIHAVKNKLFKHTDESKRKISNALIGIKRSEETKKRMSDSQKGRKVSEETKRKNSEAHKGRILSEETKRKMSKNSGKSKNVYFYNRNNILCFSFNSVREASDYFLIPKSSLAYKIRNSLYFEFNKEKIIGKYKQI